MRGRKGVISDIGYLVFGFFIAAIALLVVAVMLGEFNVAVQELPDDIAPNETVKNWFNEETTSLPGAIDIGLFLTYFFLHIGIIFLGLLLRTHPVLFVFIILVFACLSIFAGVLSNAFNEVAGNTNLETYADRMPLTSWLLDNYMLLTLIMAFLDAIIFFAIADPSGGGVYG